MPINNKNNYHLLFQRFNINKLLYVKCMRCLKLIYKNSKTYKNSLKIQVSFIKIFFFLTYKKCTYMYAIDLNVNLLSNLIL